MASIIDSESANENFNISPRDAVRREALRYFSSNPGMDTAAPNVGLHNSACTCLSARDMSVQDLARLSLGLLDRNTSVKLAQKYIEAMGISPICDYSEFDCTFSPNKDLWKLAIQTGTSQIILDAQIFPSVNLAGNRRHTKPRRFLEQSLLAAGILPGDKFDRKLGLAKSVMEKEITVFRDVEAARKQIHIGNPQADIRGHPELLLASCGMDQELGYDKREICGKLVYWSDINNDAYTALETIKIAPFELFEKFGPYDWENCVVTCGATCRHAAEECLSLIRKILPNETALHRKTTRYIVCHVLRLAGTVDAKLELTKGVAEKIASAKDSVEIQHIENKEYII
ncbi:hypothetical protein D6C88_09379 [Aureobasidium pullulans]|nr:hypothetical protein D6C88_09379 [Aureobasidium pullulans]